MLVTVVTEKTGRYRDVLALGLLAVVGMLLVVKLAALLSGNGGGVPGFDDRALAAQSGFVDPVFVILVVTAVVITTHLGSPTGQARLVTVIAVAVLVVMAVLGVVTWLSGLTSDHGDRITLIAGSGKVAGSFRQLTLLALVALAGFFVGATLTALGGSRAAGAVGVSSQSHASGAGTYLEPALGSEPEPDPGPDFDGLGGLEQGASASAWARQYYQEQPDAPPQPAGQEPLTADPSAQPALGEPPADPSADPSPGRPAPSPDPSPGPSPDPPPGWWDPPART